MKRHNGRVLAVLSLYNMDINQFNKEETLKTFNEILDMELSEEYPVEIDNKYAEKLINGVMDNLDKIDSIISNNLVKYTLDRLSYVDRAIIRVATYELLEHNPKNIVINEALEITKDYSSIDNDKQVNFNNSVLDKIATSIEKG